MSELDTQRQVKTLTDMLERLRKADIPVYTSSTWTPVLSGTGTAGTFTYVVQFGTYTRIGNRIFAFGRINISAITVAPTGNLTITGLPVTAANTATGYAGGATLYGITGITYGAGYTTVAGLIGDTTTTISLIESGSNIQAIFLPATALVLVGGGAELIFLAEYQV